jgi:quercetin dioxygenase-like cupin family protein
MQKAILALGLSMAAAAAPLAHALAAEPAPAPVLSPAITVEQTLTGQPVVLPQGAVAVAMRLAEFPAGFQGPVHKQPYARYAYVLSGRLRVNYEEQKVTKEFGPGAFMVEGIDQWHSVETIGPAPVKLLVIDQTPPGAASVVIKGR